VIFLNTGKLWRTLFGAYSIGDRVRVRHDSGWIFTGWKGKVVDIKKARELGERVFLLKADRSVEELNLKSSRGDPHLIGYFRFEHLELIGDSKNGVGRTDKNNSEDKE